MLRLAYLISKYRAAVIVVLFLPIIAFLFSDKFSIGMVPENPHLLFSVEFSVPARSAKEISKKVTEPSEKVFNGLPDLIGIQSETLNESARVELRFHERAEARVVYLNIQEKMDRIKLMLPGDVESYKVRKVTSFRPADIQLNFSTPEAPGKIREALAPFQMVVSRVEPSMDDQEGIRVDLDPQKMAQNKMAVSEVVGALRSLGITTALGRTRGIMFETGKAFQNIDDVKSALIGARGHRPIKLEDVASVRIVHRDPISRVKIWTDPERASNGEIIEHLQTTLAGVKVRRPLWGAIIEQALQPALLIMLCFLLNLYVIRVLHLPMTSMFFLAVMGGLICIHFLFWKGLFFPPLTVLDLHALAFTLIVGSMFLSVLYIRIRSFFGEGEGIKRAPKSLEQAKLFSLAELMPTFIVLILASWITALPVLTTAVNLPSRVILEAQFYVGFPVLFVIIVVMLLSTPGEFLTKKIHRQVAKMHWDLSPQHAKWGVWTLLIFTAMVFAIFMRIDVGVPGLDTKADFSEKMVHNLRGYGDRLIYRRAKGTETSIDLVENMEYQDRSKSQPSKVYEFSHSGLRFLGDLDLLGFTDGLKSLQSGLTFGHLVSQKDNLEISFSAGLIGAQDVPSLLLGKTSSKVQSKPLQSLTNVRVENIENRILRDNMTTGDRVWFKEDHSRGSFQGELLKSVEPTPWTGYLLDQFRRFQSYHLVSLIFLFLVFAIYLNSFIRSGLVVIFALSTAGFVYLVHQLLPIVMHADSLWLINVGAFMALFQILVLSRIIDIERTRGFDRDVCIKDVKHKLAAGVYWCSWSFVLALFVAGLTEFIPGIPTLGFWREALYMSVLTGVILVFSTHILFPLFYLTSEEVVNEIAFKLYKWNPLRKRSH